MKKYIKSTTNTNNISWFVDFFPYMLEGIGFTEVGENKYITRYLNNNEYIFVQTEGANKGNLNSIWLYVKNAEDGQFYIDLFINNDIGAVMDRIDSKNNKEEPDIGNEDVKYEIMSNWHKLIETLQCWW